MSGCGPERAEEILQAISGKKILVVGDVMLDRYIHGRVSRISPEAPVPIVQVSHERHVPGGASNVALNIAMLGGTCLMAGFCGPDRDGIELQELLTKKGVDTGWILSFPGRRTTVKTRILADRQQVVRVDWDFHDEPEEVEMGAFCDALRSAVEACDAVILEDYGKGVLSQRVFDEVVRAARRLRIPIGLDPKDDHALQIHDLTFATPNRKEAFLAAGIREPEPDEHPLEDQALLRVAEILLEKWGVEHLLITLGAQGMLLISEGAAAHHVPTRAREVFDVSGAGDTVIAVLLSALAAGASSVEAAELANAAAGVVVSKIGTATCTKEELLGVLL